MKDVRTLAAQGELDQMLKTIRELSQLMDAANQTVLI
jgi:hypothetical protein